MKTHTHGMSADYHEGYASQIDGLEAYAEQAKELETLVKQAFALITLDWQPEYEDRQKFLKKLERAIP